LDNLTFGKAKVISHKTADHVGWFAIRPVLDEDAVFGGYNFEVTTQNRQKAVIFEGQSYELCDSFGYIKLCLNVSNPKDSNVWKQFDAIFSLRSEVDVPVEPLDETDFD
jgi:hypothetical protein